MLTAHHLHKTFPGLYRPVLCDVHFNLAPGDFCVLIGANGSGKSTLFQILSGQQRPSSGHVISGGPIAQVVQNTSVGTVPQMTVLENLALSLARQPRLLFYRRFRKEALTQLKELHLGLESFIETPMGKLSGGQQQVIATLMALNQQAPILLLDEHTSALDPKMQEFLMKLTADKIVQRGLTAMMITHSMADALNYGNRLMMLHQGSLVLDIAGPAKKDYELQQLLDLFHHYQEGPTAQGVPHEH